MPSDAFVPARWVCAENDRDLKRCPSHAISLRLPLLPLNPKKQLSFASPGI